LEPTWKEEEHWRKEWLRESQDNMSLTDNHKEYLLKLCNTQLLIANIRNKWPKSQDYTCYTSIGKSIINYLLLFKGIIEQVQN